MLRHCWLGDGKDIHDPACKTLGFGLSVVNIWLELCTPYSSSCQRCGLRPSVLGQDRSETKIGLSLGLARCVLGLGLAGLVLCCETRSVTLVDIMILKDTATFQVLVIVFLFRAWNITAVEINRGVQLLRRKIRQVPLFTSAVVLVLRIWSCLHHCQLSPLTTSIMVTSNKIQNGNILLPSYPLM